MTQIHPSASDENFQELQRDPFFEVVVDLIADHLADAFDDPAGGEVDRWTLSALPAANRTDDRHRLFTLTIGPVDVLYVERFMEDGEIVDYRVAAVVSASALGAEPDALASHHPLLTFDRAAATAPDTDGDVLTVSWFVSDDGADEQFFALPLAAATRALADRLAAQGRGPYATHHNRAFAAHVLGESTGDPQT